VGVNRVTKYGRVVRERVFNGRKCPHDGGTNNIYMCIMSAVGPNLSFI
jgi:hypothetical protein